MGSSLKCRAPSRLAPEGCRSERLGPGGGKEPGPTFKQLLMSCLGCAMHDPDAGGGGEALRVMVAGICQGEDRQVHGNIEGGRRCFFWCPGVQ